MSSADFGPNPVPDEEVAAMVRCAHPACGCGVLDDEYCGSVCRSAVSAPKPKLDHCGCGHVECGADSVAV
jgi:hypothetical protein